MADHDDDDDDDDIHDGHDNLDHGLNHDLDNGTKTTTTRQRF